MIRRIANKNSFVGVVYDSDSEEEQPGFCSTCATVGVMSKSLSEKSGFSYRLSMHMQNVTLRYSYQPFSPILLVNV